MIYVCEVVDQYTVGCAGKGMRLSCVSDRGNVVLYDGEGVVSMEGREIYAKAIIDREEMLPVSIGNTSGVPGFWAHSMAPMGETIMWFTDELDVVLSVECRMGWVFQSSANVAGRDIIFVHESVDGPFVDGRCASTSVSMENSEADILPCQNVSYWDGGVVIHHEGVLETKHDLEAESLIDGPFLIDFWPKFVGRHETGDVFALGQEAIAIGQGSKVDRLKWVGVVPGRFTQLGNMIVTFDDRNIGICSLSERRMSVVALPKSEEEQFLNVLWDESKGEGDIAAWLLTSTSSGATKVRSLRIR
ncbi:hypothetical protein [Rubinisphaera margarita]|uniref:hypothetical protein n=1 Tax=Rubinisphaera margarita TaxID=2909586 RepID=UPI001EE8F9CF|nr:hypothetical protein [Rubinisphaera margarita]MCG6158098.1 hypothetical protein [Rubinisphaera margarita]